MSTLDKDVYERLYKTIEQAILEMYLTSNERRWRTFYKYMDDTSLPIYHEYEHKDPQVSIEVNRRHCEHIKVLITIDYDHQREIQSP